MKLILIDVFVWYNRFRKQTLINIFTILKKLRRILEWPERRIWLMLLQSVLKGKAHEAYSAVPLTRCCDYVGNGIFRIPLLTIRLFSDMVSGSVVAGIRNVLPVSLLTGNDLTGKRVFLYPKWFLSRSLRQDITYLTRRLRKLFPSCAATRALAKKWPKTED